MDIKKINMYNRLRDHFVPSSVLDYIFGGESDIKTYIDFYSQQSTFL